MCPRCSALGNLTALLRSGGHEIIVLYLPELFGQTF